MTTFRAAYWISADHQSDVVLTDETMSGLSDVELLTAANEMIDAVGLEREEGDEIVIGDYTR